MKALGILMLLFFFATLMVGLNQNQPLMESVQHSILVFVIFSVLILLISVGHKQSTNKNLRVDLEGKDNSAPND